MDEDSGIFPNKKREKVPDGGKRTEGQTETLATDYFNKISQTSELQLETLAITDRLEKMEDTERLVLRRRKQYLSEVVVVTTGLLNDLKALEVITDDTFNLILSEKVNSVRMQRLIDAILALKQDGGFSKLCLALSNQYKWLSRDLLADLRVENGEIEPTPELLQEAAVLVHRKFGTSKRFSETDKKDMAEMIAIKLHITQEEWQQDLSKSKDEYAEVMARLKAKDELALRIYDMTRTFVRDRESQLVTHAHDMVTTQDVIRKCLQEPTSQVLDQLRDNLERLFKQMALSLNQREALYYEKQKCLKLLGVKQPKVALDEVIGRLTGTTVNSKMEVEDKTAIIRKLEKQVETLEKKVEKFEEGEKRMKFELAERDREISKLRHMVQI